MYRKLRIRNPILLLTFLVDSKEEVAMAEMVGGVEEEVERVVLVRCIHTNDRNFHYNCDRIPSGHRDDHTKCRTRHRIRLLHCNSTGMHPDNHIHRHHHHSHNRHIGSIQYLYHNLPTKSRGQRNREQIRLQHLEEHRLFQD